MRKKICDFSKYIFFWRSFSIENSNRALFSFHPNQSFSTKHSNRTSLLFYQNHYIEKLALNETRQITMRQLIQFGLNMTENKLIRSANYCRWELMVRLANRLRAFQQQLPYVVVALNPRIEKVYRLYADAFDALHSLDPITSLKQNRDFCFLLNRLLRQHLPAIPLLATGMAECSQADLVNSHIVDKFMMDTLRTRIGRRVLAEQHVALSEEFNSRSGSKVYSDKIGIIDQRIDAKNLVQKCFDISCKHPLISRSFSSSTLKPKLHISTGGSEDDIKFLYIPDHIEYILIELIKNGLFFQLQAHSSQDLELEVGIFACHQTKPVAPLYGKYILGDKLSPVSLDKQVSGPTKSPIESITFRLSDKAGGFNKSILPPNNPDLLWSFSQGINNSGKSEENLKDTEFTFDKTDKDSGKDMYDYSHPPSAREHREYLDNFISGSGKDTDFKSKHETDDISLPNLTEFSKSETRNALNFDKSHNETANGSKASKPRLRLGLQLARVFAQYWGGDIKIMSLGGYGSDVYVKISCSGYNEEHLRG